MVSAQACPAFVFRILLRIARTRPWNPFENTPVIVVTMDRANVDTDQIIPKQFLKRIERTGFGQFLFFDWRFLADGRDNPDFELNRAEVAGASVLVTRRNFGSGSSREHAVWALGGLWLSRRPGTQLCRHFLQQLLQERCPAGRLG